MRTCIADTFTVFSEAPVSLVSFNGPSRVVANFEYPEAPPYTLEITFSATEPGRPTTAPVSSSSCIGRVFTVRRYALHGLSYRNSVRPSVCPSVCQSVRLSVTLVHCVHMVRPTIMISSRYGSPIILVSGDITFVPKFEGVTPSEGVE